ncbi:hypothetical protein JTB14_007796 [Gonioctena quinquepunctata]|nr:hypothetical protein JTB14_007796 [Gonioctena quinquepunctata]
MAHQNVKPEPHMKQRGECCLMLNCRINIVVEQRIIFRIFFQQKPLNISHTNCGIQKSHDYYYVPEETRTKWEGYRVLNPETNRIKISRTVKFFEDKHYPEKKSESTKILDENDEIEVFVNKGEKLSKRKT